MGKPRPSDLAIQPDDFDDVSLEDRGRPAGTSHPPPQYIDLDTIRSVDQLMAVISQRTYNGVITVAFFKVFDRDGREERTSFISDALEVAFRELVDITFSRVAEIKSNPALLKELQKAAGLEIPPGGIRSRDRARR